MKQAPRFLCLAASAVFTLAAQKAGTPPVTGTTPSTGSPGKSTNPNNNTNTSTSPDNGNMPMFFYGSVAMADGSPVPTGIVLKRLCPNDQRTVAYADTKGHFNFQTGAQSSLNNGILPDASDSGTGFGGNPGGAGNSMTRYGGNTSSSLMGCELKAELVGYTSDEIALDRTNSDPNLGTIVLRRMANVEGTSVSATSLNAPNDARKAFEKGMQASHKNKPEEAIKNLEKAVEVYPKYANAWLELGRANMQLKNTDRALECFKKALEADNKLVEAHTELGLNAVRQKNWQEGAEYLDTALRLDPVDYPQIWFPDAVANFNLKKYDAAEKSVRETIKRDVQHKTPQADQLLGYILATKRDFSGAATELQTYLKLVPDAKDAELTKTQLAQIQQQAQLQQADGTQPKQ
jgi:tetratricopeptide (TPR) repeat protein